jgi:hypothetical protein
LTPRRQDGILSVQLDLRLGDTRGVLRLGAPMRSPEAQAYRKWYNTRRWRVTRAWQLRINPLCAMCETMGRVTAATVCDHKEPHRGDPVAFWQGPFQSLCAPCHSGPKQSAEVTGRDKTVGLDGWPVER